MVEKIFDKDGKGCTIDGIGDKSNPIKTRPYYTWSDWQSNYYDQISKKSSSYSSVGLKALKWAGIAVALTGAYFGVSAVGNYVQEKMHPSQVVEKQRVSSKELSNVLEQNSKTIGELNGTKK